MVSSIDPTATLTAYLRRQLGSVFPLHEVGSANRTGAKGGAATVRQAAGPGQRKAADAASEESGRQDLASSVARRVATIDRQDPDRRRKAFRVFLESLLLHEWGEHLINDPGFQRLVGDVQEQMEADARLVPLMDEAAERLLAPSMR